MCTLQKDPLLKRPILRAKGIYLAVLAVSVLLDQLTKLWAVKVLLPKENSTIPIIQDVLHFKYLENRGAAFGMLQDHRWVFLVLSTLGILALLVYLGCSRSPFNLTELALCLIAGGGIGNMIDRVANGYVVDFVYAVIIDFAIFNLADAFVCVGCGLVILSFLLQEIAAAKKKKGEANANDRDAK